MKIDNSLYGGFVVSKNVLRGVPIRYSYREESERADLNGWTLYSELDDDKYVRKSENFLIVSAESIYKIAPVMIEIFSAPYGTDLFWKYEEGVHVGFYDLKKDKDVEIQEILQN